MEIDRQTEMTLLMECLRPGAQYTIVDGLLYWQDNPDDLPTDEEMMECRASILHSMEVEQIRRARQQVFIQESDPMAFKLLRGEVTMEAWQAKIEEIRQRLPYPE